jgi:hypothetical protein
MYNGALEDMRLGSDPLTGNRYAFTGGNPTSRVELDGHNWFSDALDTAGEWIDHNADALGEALVGTVETMGGVAGMFGGAALVVSSAGLCVAGAIPSIGTSCVAGAAGVAAGSAAVVAGAGLAVDGAMRLGNGIARMENPEKPNAGSSGSAGKTPETKSKEIPGSAKTFDEARNKGRAASGIGDDAIPYLSEVGPQKGKTYVGMQSPDGKSGWRIDWDPKNPKKGLHVNWWKNFDRTKKRSELGPESQRGYYEIPDATYQDYMDIVRHFPKS